ncbi:molybdopterin synthase sulfur carrier subunit [Phlebotomus argentipes]|uniref:molybdopterin synthase sulfur carrier subunit n=1 Tax=Phlebotomus argentipes TaxID=94469 RepID=UPI0028938248|nr:molybdopterin synthase sulfur carrier subunit [Phlebotomus argentipes]
MSDRVQVKVLFFAKCREIAGVSSVLYCVPPRVDRHLLVDEICDKFGFGNIRENLIVAINEQYCSAEAGGVLEIKEGDEIALIPPISGG